MYINVFLWIITAIIGFYIVFVHHRNFRKPPLFVKLIWVLIFIATIVGLTVQFVGLGIGQDYFYYLEAQEE